MFYTYILPAAKNQRCYKKWQGYISCLSRCVNKLNIQEVKTVSAIICAFEQNCRFIKEDLLSCFLVINTSNFNVHQIKQKLNDTTELMVSGVLTSMSG